MTELTASTRATSLVPGDPAAIRALARRLHALAGGLDDAAGRLSAIRSGTWRGAAGDAFRSVLGDQPARFSRAAASFGAARAACACYADALEGAQATAARAATEFDAAQQLSRRWEALVAAHVAAHVAARQRCGPEGAAVRTLGPMGPAPPAADPGAGLRAYAERLLATAGAEVTAAGCHAAAMIEEAARAAPSRPSILLRVLHQGSEFVAGFAESVRDLGEFAWTYSPARLVIDPLGWERDGAALVRGVESSVQHPVEFGKSVVDWETWQSSPARALGHLAPDVLMLLATSGGTAVASGAEEAAAATGRAAKAAKIAEQVQEATKGSRVIPAATTVERLERLRRDISGGDHPASFTAGDGSPAARATERQAAVQASVTDVWANTRLLAGDLIAARGVGADPGADPGAAQAFLANVAGPLGSSGLGAETVYRVNRDIDVAASHAYADGQPGGRAAIRIYLPDLHELVARGVLTAVSAAPGGHSADH